MNEKFIRDDGFNNQALTILDDGIYFVDYNFRLTEQRAIFYPWGSIDTVKNSLGSIDIRTKSMLYPRNFYGEKKDRKRIAELWKSLSQINANAKTCLPKICDIKTGMPIDANKEHIVYCNVCGNIFCYTEQDKLNNEKMARLEKQARGEAVLSALAVSTVQSSLDSAEADRYHSKIVDYSRCPKCNSTNLKEITEEERKTIEGQQQKQSPIEEIKRFKELLDSGIITQEEFDAKKKQLLGL